jgi:hypothetical protein
MGLARQGEVVDVAPTPGKEASILDALDGLTDAELVHGHFGRLTFLRCS